MSGNSPLLAGTFLLSIVLYRYNLYYTKSIHYLDEAIGNEQASNF